MIGSSEAPLICQKLRTFFAKVSAGGKVGHPLKEEFWGSTFGDLTDRFGFRWMPSFDKPKK